MTIGHIWQCEKNYPKVLSSVLEHRFLVGTLLMRTLEGIIGFVPVNDVGTYIGNNLGIL